MLIIQRKTAWFAKMSHLKIILNGSRIGNIEEGEIKSFEMKKGSYILQIKGLFVHSQLVKLEVVGDQKTLYPNVTETLLAAEELVKDGLSALKKAMSVWGFPQTTWARYLSFC